MDNIIKFPERNPKRKDADPALKRDETFITLGRIIESIDNDGDQKGMEKEMDMECMKDIFSSFSVKHKNIIKLLSELQENGIININDKVLIFVIFASLRPGSVSDRLIFDILKGKVDGEPFVDMPENIKEYVISISANIRSRIEERSSIE